jgi:acyl carrier protein
VELGEVEAAVERLHGVRQCVVLTKEDESGSSRLVAYIARAPGAQIEAEFLRNELKTGLPHYMVPSAFVYVDEIPLTANGKVDRTSLLAFDSSGAEAEPNYVAPRTAFETALCEVWSEVLDVGQVSVNDNFFDLGGHSLLATQVIARMEEAFGVEVSLRAFFESPTVAELSEVVIGQLMENEGDDGLMQLLDEVEAAA